MWERDRRDDGWDPRANEYEVQSVCVGEVVYIRELVKVHGGTRAATPPPMKAQRHRDTYLQARRRSEQEHFFLFLQFCLSTD